MNVHQATLGERNLPGFFSKIRPYINSSTVPFICIIFVLGLQITMVLGRAINWDEFYHYYQVQLFADHGILTEPLQSFHVRLFQWLTWLPGTGIDQIVVSRVFMLVCEVIALAGIATLAARFTDWTTGLICALGYLSSGFVLQHGFSLRADPVLAGALMSALCVLGCTRFRGGWLLAFGALLAFAAMISIKLVLYAPAFIAVAWWRWSQEDYRPAFIARLGIALMIGAVLFGILYLYHSTVGVSINTSGSTLLKQSAEKMFFLGVPPYWMLILKFVSISVPLVAMIILFPLAVSQSKKSITVKIALIGLFLPITQLAFYFNALPYFYTFMLPPVAVACSLPVAMMVRRYGGIFVALIFLVSATNMWIREDKGIIDKQRQIQMAARTIFPDKISYFDFCGFLPLHDKSNVFMTHWVSELYLAGAAPPMREIMQHKTVPLVLAIDDMFTALMETPDPQRIFLQQDAATLRDTYLPFWGPFWVAGKDVPADARELDAEFLVPGPYTVSGGAIEIDGQILYPNDVIELDRGVHRITATEGRATRLTWGNRLHKPDEPPPSMPYWSWF